MKRTMIRYGYTAEHCELLYGVAVGMLNDAMRIVAEDAGIAMSDVPLDRQRH